MDVTSEGFVREVLPFVQKGRTNTLTWSKGAFVGCEEGDTLDASSFRNFMRQRGYVVTEEHVRNWSVFRAALVSKLSERNIEEKDMARKEEMARRRAAKKHLASLIGDGLFQDPDSIECLVLEYFRKTVKWIAASAGHRYYVLTYGGGLEMFRVSPNFRDASIVQDLVHEWVRRDPTGWGEVQSKRADLIARAKEVLEEFEGAPGFHTSLPTVHETVVLVNEHCSGLPDMCITEPELITWKDRPGREEEPTALWSGNYLPIQQARDKVAEETPQLVCPPIPVGEHPYDPEARKARLEAFKARGKLYYPAWQEFLDRASSSDVYMAAIWKIFEPNDRGRQLIWSYCTGNGGQSMVWKTISTALGKMAHQMQNATSLADSFTEGQFYLKRLGIVSDCNNAHILEYNLIKKLTGSDPLYVNQKNQAAFTATGTNVKVAVFGNRYPKYDTMDVAMVSRVLLFKVQGFPSSFAGDPTFPVRLAEQLNSFLAACEDMERLLCPVEGSTIPVPSEMFRLTHTYCDSPIRTTLRRILQNEIVVTGNPKEILKKDFVNELILRMVSATGAHKNQLKTDFSESERRREGTDLMQTTYAILKQVHDAEPDMDPKDGEVYLPVRFKSPDETLVDDGF